MGIGDIVGGIGGAVKWARANPQGKSRSLLGIDLGSAQTKVGLKMAAFQLGAAGAGAGIGFAATGTAEGALRGGQFGQMVGTTALMSPWVRQRLLAACFPAGTAVGVASGLQPIESVRSGDRVWAYDLKRGKWQLCEVTETFERDYDGNLIQITVDDETIEATEHHPVWVIAGEGLESRPHPEHVPEGSPETEHGGRWVEACHLREGDVVLLRSGKLEIIRTIAVRLTTEKVYNFRVAELQNYAVGVSQVLVHNNSGGLPTRQWLDDEKSFAVPYGFTDADEYRSFARELRKQLPEGVEPVFQGSSVTGKKYTTGETFDVGRRSDFDIGLISSDLFEKAKSFGAKVKTDPQRIGPVQPNTDLAKHLGVNELLGTLSTSANRKVEFNLYQDIPDASRKPVIWIPGGLFGGTL